jgi:hypothetical protein
MTEIADWRRYWTAEWEGAHLEEDVRHARWLCCGTCLIIVTGPHPPPTVLGPK